MHKTVLHVLALIIAVLLLVQAYCGRRETVARARAAASHLRLQRDSLLDAIEARDRERSALIRERQIHEAEVTQLRESVAHLELCRSADQLSVRRLPTVGALQDRLRAAFPELGGSAWGVTTLVLDDRDTLGLEYLMVPAWFAETFIIDHANAASASYQDLSRCYIAELEKPRIRLPSIVGLVGAAGVGLVVGRVLR